MRGEHYRGGDRGNAFTATGQPEPIGGRRRDRHRCRGRRRQHGLSLLATGTEPRGVADDLDGDVPDDKTSLGHNLRSPRKQGDAGGTGQLESISAEVGAKVPDPGGGEERIAGGMRGDVGIGVADQSPLTWPGQPGQRQCSLIIAERMNVHTDSYAW